MPEEFGKSFIPQRRIDPRKAGLKIHNTVDTFAAFTIIVFSVVLFSIAGIIGSGYFLDNQITQLTAHAKDLTSNINEMEVDQLVRLDNKINTVAGLMNKHTSLTEFREFLEDNIQKDIQVLEYIFTESNESESRKLIIKGEAKSYNTLVNQSDFFKNHAAIKDADFSDMEVTEFGTINFTATLTIKENAFAYNI